MDRFDRTRIAQLFPHVRKPRRSSRFTGRWHRSFGGSGKFTYLSGLQQRTASAAERGTDDRHRLQVGKLDLHATGHPDLWRFLFRSPHEHRHGGRRCAGRSGTDLSEFRFLFHNRTSRVRMAGAGSSAVRAEYGSCGRVPDDILPAGQPDARRGDRRRDQMRICSGHDAVRPQLHAHCRTLSAARHVSENRDCSKSAGDRFTGRAGDLRTCFAQCHPCHRLAGCGRRRALPPLPRRGGHADDRAPALALADRLGKSRIIHRICRRCIDGCIRLAADKLAFGRPRRIVRIPHGYACSRSSSQKASGGQARGG